MADKRRLQNKRSVAPARDAKGRLLPGQTANPGGRPKSLREIERMLDAEHRTVEEMRETYNVVRKVARGVEEPVYYKGEIVGHVMKYDSGWMELYLNRIQGPVRDLEIDLSDASEETLRYLADKGIGRAN